MTDTEKVRKIILDKGLKLQYIAQVLGITRYSLAKKLGNQTEFKASEITELCKLLGISSLKERDTLFFAQKVDYKSTRKEAIS